MKKVSILVGSLRRASVARKLAKNIIEMFPSNYDVKIVEIRDLPLYNFDYDDNSVSDVKLPEIYKEFRNEIKSSDGVFMVTPENNRLVPACLKNAIDICSKPNGDLAFKNKPVGIVSHSIGKMGGYSSQKSIQLAISYFDAILLNQPEAFIGNSHDLFTDGEKINNESTVNFIQDYVNRFVELVDKQ